MRRAVEASRTAEPLWSRIGRGKNNMALKTIIMVKRKAGLSPEAFREGYEKSHSRIAVRLFGHLWPEYRRNYLETGRTFDGAEGGPDEIEYDAIWEYTVADEAAREEAAKIYLANVDLIKEDEARWFDQKKSWIVSAETIEEKLR
jgi:hypothetical protein